MCADSWIKYTHDKPLYKDEGKCNCACGQKEGCKCFINAKACSAGESKKFQNSPDLQSPETAPKTIEAHNDGRHETDAADPAINAEPSNQVDNQGVTQEDDILKALNSDSDDIWNGSAVCFDDSSQAGKGSRNTGLPLTPEVISTQEHSGHNAHNGPAEKGQADAAGNKSCGQTDGCGLLSYRKWWELTEVDISVKGKLITGTPIFIEDNTLRVVNENYSYFIPLEKVDYIRTVDGLRSSFNSSDDKPAK